jgi:hypothetical protein
MNKICGPTQSLCFGDHAIICAYSFLSRQSILAPLLFEKCFIFQNRSQDFFFLKALPKLSIYKTIGT